MAMDESSVPPAGNQIRRAIGQPMKCGQCGVKFARRSAMQLFCTECSESRAADRRRKWQEANPVKNAELKKRYVVSRKSPRIEKGKRISDAARWPLDAVFPDESGMKWVRRLAIPYTLAFSKNHLLTMGETGHVVRRQEINAAKDRLADAVREAIAGIDVLHGKLWLAMIVQKPCNRSDAVNFVDHVCDSVAKATGLDDRWYCFKQIDWQIVKVEPLLMLGLGQDIDEPHQACAYCGRVLPFGMFWGKRHNKHKVGRECKDCMRIDR